MKRLFIAIKIEPGDILIDHYHMLKRGLAHEKITWVSPEKMHITLKFFGDTFEERIPVIVSAMNRVAFSYNEPEFHIKGVGIFGSRYQPRVIWLGIPDGGSISDPADKLMEELEKDGWERDRQNFVPHLTVGRIKFIQDKRNFQAVLDDFGEEELQKVRIGEMILYESNLTPGGPVYKVIEKALFRK